MKLVESFAFWLRCVQQAGDLANRTGLSTWQK